MRSLVLVFSFILPLPVPPAYYIVGIVKGLYQTGGNRIAIGGGQSCLLLQT